MREARRPRRCRLASCSIIDTFSPMRIRIHPVEALSVLEALTWYYSIDPVAPSGVDPCTVHRDGLPAWWWGPFPSTLLMSLPTGCSKRSVPWLPRRIQSAPDKESRPSIIVSSDEQLSIQSRGVGLRREANPGDGALPFSSYSVPSCACFSKRLWSMMRRAAFT